MVDDTDSAPSAAPLRRVAAEPSFWRALRGALFAPRALFAGMRELTALGAPVRFAAGMGLLRGLFMSAIVVFFTTLLQGSELFPATGLDDDAHFLLAKDLAVYLVGYPLAAVAGVFASGVVVQGVAALSGGRGSYARSVRVAAYASAPIFLVWIFHTGASMTIWPGTSWGPSVVALGWGGWVVAEGVTVLHGARRAWAYPVALASLAGVWMVNARVLQPLVHALRAALRLS